MSKRYNVTLNFSFRKYDPRDDYDYESEEDDYEGSKTVAEAKTEPKSESQRKREAFQRTEEYFRTHDVIEHIKSNDALGFVEFVCCNGEVLSAEWDEEKFQIHMVVETEQSKEELIEDLRSNSLEDGEYEACGDTGWLVMTRGPNGEQLDSPWNMSDFWLYGDTDYRDNEIEVKKIKSPKKPIATEPEAKAEVLAN